jgi:uncharacterized membrane protein YagU involved in acid resistance
MNGFIAGIIANIPILILDKTVSFFKLEKVDYEHFAAVLAFHGKIDSIGKLLFGLTVELMFAGFLGIAFAYLIKTVTSRYFYLKGAIFGAFIWFVIYAIDVFFKIPEILEIDFAASVSHYIGSILWGVGSAWTFEYLKKRHTSHGC